MSNMDNLKEFIEVTCLYDRKKAFIRTACIEAVLDCAAEKDGCGIKYDHRIINYSGRSLDVIESLEEICNMIYKSEL